MYTLERLVQRCTHMDPRIDFCRYIRISLRMDIRIFLRIWIQRGWYITKDRTTNKNTRERQTERRCQNLLPSGKGTC